MEEEDKDAFQEEEKAGESFLQPSSKSRFQNEQKRLFLPCTAHFCLCRFTLRKRKRRPGTGASEDASDSVSVCRSVS